MSLGAFIGGLGSGTIQGVDAGSAYNYRASIIKMRQLQTKQAQNAAADTQNSRYVALTGAMERGGSLPPGMNYQPGALAWAKQNLPAPEYAQIEKNAATEGWSPAQLQAMNGAVSTSPGAATPDTAAALAQDQSVADWQNMPAAQPTGQAKGGVVPMPNYRTRYASGGPIDPDVSAAVAQSNGQPNSPSPSAGAIPTVPPADMYMPAGPAVPLPAQSMQSASAAALSSTPAQPAIPPPPQPNSAGAPAVAPQAIPTHMSAPTPAPQMAPLHPSGLQPLANPKAPLNVPPQIMQAATPAEAAMKHGQIAFGLHPGQNPQANPAQTKANYTELQHGAGAESNANVQAARYKLFGQGVGAAPLGLQNASLINNLYNYDLENHGPAVAAADSFAVLQNYRINMQMYGGAAMASFQSGNLQAAAHYLQEAYAFFPDGNDVSVKPGPNNSLVATRTTPDGKVLDTNTFATPNDLSSLVQATTSFENYNTSLNNAQKLALDTANVGDQIRDRDQSTADDNARTGADVANVGDQINDRDQSTKDDNTRTAYDVSGKGKDGAPKPPTLGEIANYQNTISATLLGPNGDGNSPIGNLVGYKDASPQLQTTLTQLATSVGVANDLDPTSAIQIGGYIMRNPSAYDPKTSTVTIRGQTYQVGTAGKSLLAPQAKATGGAVTPAARAMANLP